MADLQAQLADIANQHNKRTEELYVKFAAVLNEKKRKCEELKRAVETAQATLQVLALRRASSSVLLNVAAPRSWRVFSMCCAGARHAQVGEVSLSLQAEEDGQTDREDAAETTASGTLEEAGDDVGSGDDAVGAKFP